MRFGLEAPKKLVQGEKRAIIAQSQSAANETAQKDSANRGESSETALDRLSEETVFFPNRPASAWVAARVWDQLCTGMLWVRLVAIATGRE